MQIGALKMRTPPSQTLLTCTHCNTQLQTGDPLPFCCRGCAMVHALLQEKGLNEFYTIRNQTTVGTLPDRTFPALQSEETYTYLDDPEFISSYAVPTGPHPTDRALQFYLEGVHCAACVWLTEKVPHLTSGVQSVRLSLANSVATVHLKPGGRFSEAALEFARLGYRPHPIREGNEQALQLKEDRSLLVRLAIAGACSGNIMLLAIAIYAGAEGSLAEIFKWISFVLFLPVALFSAQPFYASANRALKARQLSIDIPIVAGLSLGFLISTYNLFQGSEQIYFDSLAALVFLLLCTRYLLRRAQRSTLSSYELLYHLIPSTVLRCAEGESTFQLTRTEKVKTGDLVLVKVGQSIPLDGVVHSGESALNTALMTGESSPVAVGPDTLVYAGTVNLHAPLEVRVAACGAQSRLGKILKNVEQGLSEKASLVSFTDQVSKWFVLATLVIAAASFYTGLSAGISEALNRFLAIVIVMCPCSFALATPLALSSAIKRCARNGILIKSAASIEKLSQVDTVFFDKTGTLTSGRFRVLEWSSDRTPESVAGIIVALESLSNHPIAHALVDYFKGFKPLLPKVENFREKLGQGVSGKIGNSSFELRPAAQASESQSETEVALFENQSRIGIIRLGDLIRPDSAVGIQKLHDLGLQTGILSGDAQGPALAVAQQTGIPTSQVHSKLSPEQKGAYLQASPFAAMVGDGANDAEALARSFLGIAVQGGVEVSMKAADIYSTQPGILPLHELIVLGRETVKVIHRNFAFSLIYNALGVAAALSGKVTPLFAAILMPMSAFTVFLSAIYGTRKTRALFKKNLKNKRSFN